MEVLPGDRELYSLHINLFSFSKGGSEFKHWGWACDQDANDTSRRMASRETLGAILSESVELLIEELMVEQTIDALHLVYIYE